MLQSVSKEERGLRLHTRSVPKPLPAKKTAVHVTRDQSHLLINLSSLSLYFQILGVFVECLCFFIMGDILTKLPRRGWGDEKCLTFIGRSDWFSFRKWLISTSSIWISWWDQRSRTSCGALFLNKENMIILAIMTNEMFLFSAQTLNLIPGLWVSVDTSVTLSRRCGVHTWSPNVSIKANCRHIFQPTWNMFPYCFITFWENHLGVMFVTWQTVTA